MEYWIKCGSCDKLRSSDISPKDLVDDVSMLYTKNGAFLQIKCPTCYRTTEYPA